MTDDQKPNEQQEFETEEAAEQEQAEAESISAEQADSPDEGTDSDVSELEQLSVQAAEYLDGWQRARAELANFKKRVERERREAYQRASGEILSKQLEIMDDLERALEDRPTEGGAATWAEGIDMVHRKFKNLLDSHNIETIEAAGQPFDPNIHEAISHEETDEVQEGYVIDVVKPGYRMGDRILRPALVRVAK